MSESFELYDEVLKLRSDVEQLKHTTNAQVRFNTELQESVVGEFKKDKSLIAVFQAVDGQKSQKEILDAVKATGDKVSNSQPTISRKLTALANLDLIEPAGRAKGSSSIIYRPTNFAKVIRLNQSLNRIKKS